MKLQDFIGLLCDKLNGNTKDFEVEIELDHCESPDIIKVEVDNEEEIITIIKGNCGT